MRLLLSLLVVSLAVVSAHHDGLTPPDYSSGLNPLCVLIPPLTFSNPGFSLSPPFQTNLFHYTCSCDFGDDEFVTNVMPTTGDKSSFVDVNFNGVLINAKANGNGISNGPANPWQPGPHVPGAPHTQSANMAFQPGWNTILLIVSCNGLGQPPCLYTYNITCFRPPGGFVVGDPQFVGLRGQSYQVHGVSGEVYNIVSDADLQYNSRFVFLNRGDCPVVNGKKQKGCFSHPGSYLGELGLKTRAGDKIHIVTGPAKDGFETVEVNGKAVEMGETVLLADGLGSVSRNTTHLASVQIGNWDFAFENSDMFLNQRVRVMDSRGLRSHGLLGQTWRETTYPNAIKYIQGQVDDYVIRDNDIFGDNFVYNTFN